MQRAQVERAMARSLSNSALVDLVTHVAQLDLDAIDAHHAAISRVADPGSARLLQAFLDDHERHLVELSAVLHELGATAPTRGDLRRLLCTGRVVVGNIGGDAGVLTAMRLNETDILQGYEQSVVPGLPRRLRELLLRNVSDERRHVGLVEDRERCFEPAPASDAGAEDAVPAS
jgi:hypothetical protein